jgi:hypothetical protein
VEGTTFDHGLDRIELVRNISETMKLRRIVNNGALTTDASIEVKAA